MNNAYADEFAELNETPPPQPEIQKLTRHILIEKPRVTKFQIDWEEEDSAPGLMPQISQQPQPVKPLLDHKDPVKKNHDQIKYKKRGRVR